LPRLSQSAHCQARNFEADWAQGKVTLKSSKNDGQKFNFANEKYNFRADFVHTF